MRGERDAVDVIQPPRDLRMQPHRRFHRGLRVKLGGERHLEQHVFHHIAAVAALKAEPLALEGHVVEAPGGRRERARNAHFALLHEQRETHAAAGGVPRGPRLARSGVGRVAVGAQRPAVGESVRERVHHLRLAAAEHPHRHRRRGHAHQQHMIQADAVEAVLQRQAALDLVRLDHRRQHVAHEQRRLAAGRGDAGEIVGQRQNAAQIVRRMPPLRRQPSVVEVQPADHAADVPRRLDRIQLVRRARHPGAVRRHRARHDRADVFGALREAQRQEAAAQGVHQAVAGGVVGFRAIDFRAAHVVGDGDQLLVRRRADVRRHIAWRHG